MKTIHFCILNLVLAISLSAFGQGTFVYDQQSADESTSSGGVGPIQQNQPLGQSFIPTLNSVGFIRLFLSDSDFNGLGATVYVNLRSDSISGPILGTTDPVFMADRFSGFPNFYFSTPLSVTQGTTYYVQPVLQSGDNTWGIIGYNAYDYSRGTAYALGAPVPSWDLWFREGVVVPEPGTWALLFVGCGVLALRRR